MTICECGLHNLPDDHAMSHEEWLRFNRWVAAGKPSMHQIPVVPEQPQLPNEQWRMQIAETALALYDWEAIFNGEAGESPAEVLYAVADAVLAAGFVPAGSEREADQNAVIDWLFRNGLTALVAAEARAHFALVPEAEGKTA